ncbi:carbon storage regulator [Nitrincola iocasae]|uniref:Carbon storage regulator n=1 Tax=Nitrincola iocasae TaxID=2614693 RepID=A0A5J6LKQ8_9GAMM|nr:carbon storage regulator [Nitrincola iocasae]
MKLGDDICLTVTCINGGQLRFGITAPKEINIVRSELIDKEQPPPNLNAVSEVNSDKACFTTAFW